MKNNVIAGHARDQAITQQVSSDIEKALAALKKNGYNVHFEEVPEQRDELAITFELGGSRQTLKVPRGSWTNAGTVYDTVLNRLDI
jgi:ABC-type transport system substrate-binding protein